MPKQTQAPHSTNRLGHVAAGVATLIAVAIATAPIVSNDAGAGRSKAGEHIFVPTTVAIDARTEEPAPTF